MSSNIEDDPNTQNKTPSDQVLIGLDYTIIFLRAGRTLADKYAAKTYPLVEEYLNQAIQGAEQWHEATTTDLGLLRPLRQCMQALEGCPALVEDPDDLPIEKAQHLLTDLKAEFVKNIQPEVISPNPSGELMQLLYSLKSVLRFEDNHLLHRQRLVSRF